MVSILQVELWSVFVGLQVALQRRIVQSDSSHAIKLLLDSSTNGHSMSLVRAIGLLRQVTSDISETVKPLLDQDREGPPYSRR
ncbi:hypothetical protein V6N12_032685 [Hibiscus sabdariffa]|uniref:RNase H type-1 domain-containing protein n=1 Tax=Hibiscus sabdariffa TaxID=183260 RepID=A0ABR2BQ60_9ROSI